MPNIPEFNRPTLEGPIIIPPIRFPEGTTFGVEPSSRVDASSLADVQEKELVIRTNLTLQSVMTSFPMILGWTVRYYIYLN